MRKLVVIGSGGHAKVIIATARALEREVVACLDDHPARMGEEVLGVRVSGTSEEWGRFADCEFVLGFGDNGGRKAATERIGAEWTTLVHPAAVVEGSVDLGEGTVIFAGAVIQPETVVGRHVILNTRCSVDHDGRIEDFVHVAPGVSICGGVYIGEGALIGVGACVKPGVKIGDWSTVGAGAAAVCDLESGGTYVGVPARRLQG